jgi:hypothetical protein
MDLWSIIYGALAAVMVAGVYLARRSEHVTRDTWVATWFLVTMWGVPKLILAMGGYRDMVLANSWLHGLGALVFLNLWIRSGGRWKLIIMLSYVCCICVDLDYSPEMGRDFAIFQNMAFVFRVLVVLFGPARAFLDRIGPYAGDLYAGVIGRVPAMRRPSGRLARSRKIAR